MLNITIKKLLLQKVGVHKRRRDHVDHLLLLWIFLSNISTYHLKVASRPVEQWNGI